MTRELEERSIRRRAHTVTIDGREKMTVTGADELVSFCEEEVAIQTSMGLLIVEGEDLHIDKLNLDEGQVIIRGLVFGATYEEEEDVAPKGGVFKRLMRR